MPFKLTTPDDNTYDQGLSYGLSSRVVIWDRHRGCHLGYHLGASSKTVIPSYHLRLSLGVVILNWHQGLSSEVVIWVGHSKFLSGIVIQGCNVRLSSGVVIRVCYRGCHQ
jgi:hypothetical protein